jgi:2-oxoglutarate ferredoxin oxidoreductase subunit alpha
MNDLNVVIAGSAGEGVQTIGTVLAQTVLAQGYAVFTWQEYESRIRGGQNRFSVRIGDSVSNAPLAQADILLVLNEGAAEKYRHLKKETGILIAPSPAGKDTMVIPFADIAKEALGNPIFANTIAAGALSAAIGSDIRAMKQVLERRFSKKSQQIVEKNLRALDLGYEYALRHCKDTCPWKISRIDRSYFYLTGNDAIAGAAAYAGCRFISAYPMTPSTGIITRLARDERLGVFAEQAEDEIAAINMAIGAAFAGARAMTATAGGGFALMVESVSLAGMAEVPLVIVVGQRPGPATGLPTRTSQADLLFVLNAGHGEFPKILLAPSDPKDAFHKTVRAFNLADRFQTPVILLTDQFLADSGCSFADLEADISSPEFHLADPSTIDTYRRYRITDTGVSPRLYPGQSRHLVTADSDEHDETGHITEDLENLAPAMVEKRIKKHFSIRQAVKAPEQHNLQEAEIVFVGWGSTRSAIVESIGLLQDDAIRAGMIHFTELWPLPDYEFPAGKTYWSVEGNATGQLARLLRSEYPLSFEGSVNRYDGLPLTAEFIRKVFHEKRK